MINPPPDQTGAAPDTSLGTLRAEIDQIDLALHGLLVARAGVVTRMVATQTKGRVALRAGREAAILRRLLARDQGALPRAAVVRIWRELFSATTSMQGRHAVAVCGAMGEAPLYAALAHEHFGALTPLRTYSSPSLALADVSSGMATVAVLPIPTEAEPARDAWWTTLARRADDPSRLCILARLPVWTTRPDGAPCTEAFVVGPLDPDPSGDDRTLIALDLSPEISRARLSEHCARAGLVLGHALLRRGTRVSDPGAALLDVAGFLDPSDPRLNALGSGTGAPVILGAYAVPLA